MLAKTLSYEHFQIETDAEGNPVELGSAGQGVTYRAFDTRLRKTVALKIVDRELLRDENNRRRFLNEARAAAALDHPNIARVTHLCSDDAEEFYYAMELVEGESLEERIARHGKMPPVEAFSLLKPIAEALIAIGQSRLVHRDIQPGNIIITTDLNGAPTVKLIDFGLAKSLGTQSGLLEQVRTAELRTSSVFHLSPEQIQGNAVIDSRADFYSLGVTLWHLMAGKPPFTGSAFEINEGHLHRELPWSELPPLPPAARHLLERILAKEPIDRPANAREVCALWEAGLAALQTHPAPGAPVLPSAPVLSPAPARVGSGAEPKLGKLGNLVPQGPLEGCAEPPPLGYLARGESGETYLVRQIPAELNALTRREFDAAVRASLEHPHTTLLNVCEARKNEVVSEWRRGVMASQLLAIRHGEVPMEIVRGWIPAVAQSVDWARENKVRRISFSPSKWLVEFLDLETDETPLDRASREPEMWGRIAVWIDPLDGFDAQLVAADSDPNQTLLSSDSPEEALVAPEEYLSAFAKAVSEVMGGHRGAYGAPLASLDENANALLSDAIEGNSSYRTASDWMVAFLAHQRPVPPRPAKPVGRIAAPASARLAASAAGTRATPATSAARATTNRNTFTSWANGLPPWLRWALPAALLIALGLLIWAFLPPRHSKEIDDFVARNGGSSFPTPTTPASQASPGSSELGSGRVGGAVQPAGSAATSKLESIREQLETASVREPFENDAGEQFVPIPIDKGFSQKGRVLFATTETTVGEFEKFANKTRWQRRPYQEANHPAVKIRPVDAIAYCEWLTKHERQAGRLPQPWVYRLPSDYEWSCAAGLAGVDEKGKETFLWEGHAWPPKANAGRFADTGSAQPEKLPDHQDHHGATAPVKSYAPNEFGIYDLAGNAAEWCWSSLNRWALRGGSWQSSKKQELNAFARVTLSPEAAEEFAGFRVVLSTIPMPKESTFFGNGADTSSASVMNNSAAAFSALQASQNAAAASTAAANAARNATAANNGAAHGAESAAAQAQAAQQAAQASQAQQASAH